MDDRQAMRQKLIEVLRDIDFDERFYAFYEAHRSQEGSALPNAKRKVFEDALMDAGIEMSYESRDKFFHRTEHSGALELTFNAAFSSSNAEFMFYVTSQNGTSAGGPFHRLAREISQLRDPAFSPDPISPRLPFTNSEQLREAVRFGATMFEDAKRAVLAHKNWGA